MRNRLLLASAVLFFLVLVVSPLSFAQSPALDAITSLRAVATAQTAYKQAYPDRGYACKLSELGPPNGSKPQGPDAASLLDPSISSGKKNGWKFDLNCPTPSKPKFEYKVSATPIGADKSSTTVYCTSQSAIIRSGPDAKSCLTNGKLVHDQP